MPDITISVSDAENAALAAIVTHSTAVNATTSVKIAHGAVRELLREWEQAPETDNDMPLSELQDGRASRDTIARRVSQVGT